MKRSGGTLFSYFKPTSNGIGSGQKTKKQPAAPLASKIGNLKPRAKISPHSPHKKEQQQSKPPLVEGSTPLAPGLLVWGRMEGHPWWPAMVCSHPSSGRLFRGGKSQQGHVQFFGQPPTRGWVPLKSMEVLTAATLGIHGDEKEVGLPEAVQEAGEAIAMSLKGKLQLVVDIPSEGEGSEGEEGRDGERGRGGEDNQENVEPMELTPLTRKRPHPLESDDSDADIGRKKTQSGRPKRVATMSAAERRRSKKRPKRALDSDDSADEYRPKSSDECESEESSSEGVEEGESETAPTSQDEEELAVTPARKKPAAKTPRSGLKTPQAKSPWTPASRTPKTPLADSPPSGGAPSGSQLGPFKHETLEWLMDHKRRDKAGRSVNDPDYNPRTLKIPTEYLKHLTPAVRQWWLIKQDNFDTILMFKVGKFYELYHMDAVVGVRELGLVFMKGDFAHSGFPEIAFGRYSQTLVQKGYKVARVEQTETPPMMEKRLRNMACPTRFDRVVNRELCSVITKGTRTLSFLDGDVTDSESAFLLAIKEKPHSITGESVYGVCFVDTCIGKFHLGQFSDDRQCSRLRTLVAHYPPAQVLYERKNLSPRTLHVVNQLLSSCIRDCLTPNTEFWDSGRTLKVLAESSYFSKEEAENGEFEWPKTLKDMLAEDDSLGLTAADNYELAVSALGACTWCLQRCRISHQLLSMGDFEPYQPVDVATERMDTSSTTPAPGPSFGRQHMVLDDITLANLDVLDHHGNTAGTLLEKIDHCVTPFGKRLLKQWLCAPLCHPGAINERLDAVSDLMSLGSVVGGVREVLRTLPDLQRLLRKIHTLGSVVHSQDHPDSRAIFYEETTYSRRKISDFTSALEGLLAAQQVVEAFAPVAGELSSRLLMKLVTLTTGGGLFPDMAEKLKFFQHSFDRNKAKKDGVIIPAKGVNNIYDDALQGIESTKAELQAVLQRQRKRLGCQNIVYWGSGRNRYQLEVPESALARHTPDDYELKSQKKGVRRYWTAEIEQLLAQLVVSEEQRDAALKDTMRALFHSFAEHLELWESATQCLARLDALLSLATYSAYSGGCRPEVVESSTPSLEICSGRHPCISQTFTGDDFIPNDVIINAGESPSGRLCVVVTGPNMGGKSTLMRQTGLIVILAQLGCFVPAECCRLSPVDRVFTRLGASDRIMAGESTFFVELSETATILQHSTPHSLVLLDELGRGTATYDGTAIACAVVRELAEQVCCRLLFSTHYHSLVEEFTGSPHIQLGHMACMVEGEGEGEQETITFLYKFIEGACPKSYGFNAARLAGIPNEVIQVARRKAMEFERCTEQVKLFRRLVSPQCSSDFLSLAQQQLTALS